MSWIRPGQQMVGNTLAQVKQKTYKRADFTPVDFTTDTRQFHASRGYETAYELDIDDGLGELFGRGFNQNPLQAQGFGGIRLVNDTAAAQAEGDFRIAVRTAQGRRLFNLIEGDLGTFDLFDSSGNKLSRKDREVLTQTANEFQTEPLKLTLDIDVSSDIVVDDAEAQTAWEFDGYRAEALE
jgi:hypothetical protein